VTFQTSKQQCSRLQNSDSTACKRTMIQPRGGSMTEVHNSDGDAAQNFV